MKFPALDLDLELVHYASIIGVHIMREGTQSLTWSSRRETARAAYLSFPLVPQAHLSLPLPLPSPFQSSGSLGIEWVTMATATLTMCLQLGHRVSGAINLLACVPLGNTS